MVDPPTEAAILGMGMYANLNAYTATHFPVGKTNREVVVEHTGMVKGEPDDGQFPFNREGGVEFGAALWPSALELAEALVARSDLLDGKHVLELGCGVGLAGLVAWALGAEVVQTDASELALELCRRNGTLNEATEGIEHRQASWDSWDLDAGQFDWILGSDILYCERQHAFLLSVLDRHLAVDGEVLLCDPMRAASHEFLRLAALSGWCVERVDIASTSSPLELIRLMRAMRIGW